MDHFDLIILGGGPAGYFAAELAARGGLKTALVEKNALGGVCVNEGCIPTKAILQSAKLARGAAGSERFGVTAEAVALDHSVVMRRKKKTVRKMHLAVKAKMKEHDVTVIDGQGEAFKIDGETFLVRVGEAGYTASKMLLATGSLPQLVPIEGVEKGIESEQVLTSRELLDAATPPETLVVIGGGAVGLEMAYYYSAAGSDVTVVEMQDTVAAGTDPEVGALLVRELTQAGVCFHLGSHVTAVQPGAVTVQTPDETLTLRAETVLLAAGRRPSLQGFKELGVETKSGAVATNHHLQTNVPGLYAAGDVNGRSMLAHTAYREAQVAVNHMLGVDDTMSYAAVPGVIYTTPEVAWVGHTEHSASAEGVAHHVVTLPLSYSGRYSAEVEMGRGFCKVLVDGAKERLLGVQIIGSYASEIIYGVGAMIENKTPLSEIERLIFPHPTVGEVLREALFALE